MACCNNLNVIHSCWQGVQLQSEPAVQVAAVGIIRTPRDIQYPDTNHAAGFFFQAYRFHIQHSAAGVWIEAPFNGLTCFLSGLPTGRGGPQGRAALAAALRRAVPAGRSSCRHHDSVDIVTVFSARNLQGMATHTQTGATQATQRHWLVPPVLSTPPVAWPSKPPWAELPAPFGA